MNSRSILSGCPMNTCILTAKCSSNSQTKSYEFDHSKIYLFLELSNFLSKLPTANLFQFWDEHIGGATNPLS